MTRLSDVVPSRVYTLRRERGWTMEELAEKADTTASMISKLEKSTRRLDFDWVERLAAAFGISEHELIGATSSSAPAVKMVPLIGDIAAGNWREAIQHSDGEVAAVGASDNAFALRARGTSMNLIVPDGGYVIVEPNMSDLREGKVYAVMNHENETTLKRYRAEPARLEPCSTDASHQEIRLGREPFTVIGQVTGAFHPL